MRKHFVTGLVILLPLAITIAVLIFLVNFFTKPFIQFVSEIFDTWNIFPDGLLFLSHRQMIQYTSKTLILLMLFGFTVSLGILARWLMIHSFFNVCDKILHRIPVVNTVYKTSQDIIKTIFSSDKNSFKQVVLVPYPRPGIYMLGLIARESPAACCQVVDQSLISVLVPTTPNPTTGFLMMFRKEDIYYLDIKPEDAIKYIVSCGVVLPEQKLPNTT